MNRLIIATLIFCGAQTSLFGGKFSDIRKSIKHVTQEYPETNALLDDREIREFSEEEMLDVVKEMISRYAGNMTIDAVGQLDSARKSLVKQLRKYKVTGIGFSIDPNFAFFWNQQNPVIDVYYKNEYGDIKYRTYQGYIDSFGLKIELAFKFNIIFFTDTDFNFYDSNKDLFIGNGIDLSMSILGGIDLTYASFRNAPGGIVILGIPIGLVTPGLSVVTGGLLTPMNYY